MLLLNLISSSESIQKDERTYRICYNSVSGDLINEKSIDQNHGINVAFASCYGFYG